MRKISILIVVLFVLVFSGPQAYAAKGDVLSAEEARSILNEIIPNVKIIHVKQSPIAGLWEIGADMNGKKSIIYIDSAKKYVIAGNIIDIKTKTSLTQESVQKISKVDVLNIPLKDAIVLGDKTAKNKVIVFSDPD